MKTLKATLRALGLVLRCVIFTFGALLFAVVSVFIAYIVITVALKYGLAGGNPLVGILAYSFYLFLDGLSAILMGIAG